MYKKIMFFLRTASHSRHLLRFFNIKDWFVLLKVDFKSHFCQEEELYNLLEEKYSVMYKYMDKHLTEYRLKEYDACKRMNANLNDQIIWVLWLQGEGKMPPIVKVCYDNLKKNNNGHEVILLTFSNLRDYLLVPDDIKSKVGKGLTYTQFSDYIRLNLLSLYGGLWIDSTFLVTSPLDERIFHTEFFSIKHDVIDNSYVGRYRWAVNFLYFKRNSIIAQHIRNLFCWFWAFNDKPIAYLFIDYCFEYERLKNNNFKKLVEAIPFSNENSLQIVKNFNEPFTHEKWSSWLSNTYVFKLSYKGVLKERTDHGKLTYYGYILKHFR